MIYELAIHHAAPGALHRAQRLLAGVLSRAAPHHLGLWAGQGGAWPDRVLALFRWPDFQTRDAFQNSVLGDAAYRNEFGFALRSSEHWILQPTGAVATDPASWRSRELFEIRIQEVLNGSQPDAAEAFRDVAAPEIRRLGGRVAAQFDVALGPRRPVFVSFLAWPDMPALQRGQQDMDRSERVAAQRADEIERFGRPLYDRPVQFLATSVFPESP